MNDEIRANLNVYFLRFYQLSQIRSPLVVIERNDRQVITSFETFLRKQGITGAALKQYCAALEEDFAKGKKKLVAQKDSSLFPPVVKLIVNVWLLFTVLYCITALIFSWMPNKPLWNWTIYQYALLVFLAGFFAWYRFIRKERLLEMRIWDDRPIEIADQANPLIP
jgi:hypothetical protein